MTNTIVIFFSVILFIEFSYGFDFQNVVRHSEEVSIVKDVISKFQNKELIAENAECTEQLGLFLDNIDSDDDDDRWALKMIDANAKIPSGVLDMNLEWLGSFDECIDIESLKTDVTGKYCLAKPQLVTSNSTELQIWPNHSPTKEYKELLHFKREQYKQLSNAASTQLLTFSYLGLCIPNKCTEEDTQNVLNSLTQNVLNSLNLTMAWTATCQTKETVNVSLDTGAIVTICYFGIFIILMAASTIYDLLVEDDKSHPLLLSFSIRTNARKLFAISKRSEELSSLHGIKTLSMMWVILGHKIMSVIGGPVTNIVDFMKYAGTTRAMFFINAVHSVDTFFVMTGMLVVYSFMKASHQGHTFNIIIYYLHRYIRLTPALIPVILVSIYWTKYLGVGPLGPSLDEMLGTPCKKHWWTTILYVQNYANEKQAVDCVGVTWYLNVDWQLYLISPIFLLFLPKLPIVGLGLILAGIAASMITGFVLTWNNSLVALMTSVQGNLTDYGRLYYDSTFTRATTWLIGCLLGYVLAKIKLEKNLIYRRVPKSIIYLIWIIILAVIPICIFVGHDNLADSKTYHPYASAFYNAFARPAWGLCIAWIIFACSIGYGGIINTFLSLPVFQIISRFTYSMYLIHINILYIIAMSAKEPEYYSLFNVFYSFWGVFALTFAISIFWVLAFESPVVILEKYLLGNQRSRSNDKPSYGPSSHQKEATPHQISGEA